MADWLYIGYCTVMAMFAVAAAYAAAFGLRALRRLPRSLLLGFAAAAVVATLTAQKTNNVPPNMNQPQMMQGGGSFQTGFTGLTGLVGIGSIMNLVNPVQTTIDDIMRGWRVESVTTNAAVSYAMPTNAALVGNWHIHGAASSFGNNRIDFGNWVFPLGTNDEAFSSFWYFIDGRIRPAPRDAVHEICAVGAPMSAVPGQSRLWRFDGDDGARILTWENFFLGGDTNCSVNAQIVLSPNGDFLTRSNDVETVCRRINPDDWDDDGVHNERDLNPTSYDGDFFGVANGFPPNANPDAYYWLDLSVTGVLGVATIRVTCDGSSDLGDHVLIARTNEVCHIPLLAGATYAVDSNLLIDYSAVSSEYAEIVTNAEDRLTVSLPLEFSMVRTSSGDALTANYILQCAPFNVGATLFSLSGICCSCETNGMGFAWVCSDGCTCGGQHEISTAATWEGYSLPFSWWGTCGCYVDVTEPSSLTDNGINLSIEMPSTFIANDDDDNDNGIVDATPPFGEYEDEVVSGRVSFVSMTLTNGIVKLQKLTGLEQGANGTRRVYADESGISPIDEGHEYTVANTALLERAFFVNPVVVSSHYQDGRVRVLWKPDSGPRSAASKRFTIVEPTVEPITDESWSLADLAADGRMHSYLYNPCAVAVGKTATFKVDVLPEDYPDSEIVWTTNMCEGAVRFVGSNVNTGRVVTVEGVSTGDVFLVVKFGDAESPQPAFFSKVVQPMAVRLRAWIIGDGTSWARTQEDVRNMVSVANDIYSQVGVNLELVEPIVLTNIPQACESTIHGPISQDQWNITQLMSLTNGTDGLECYFIKAFGDEARTLGCNCEYGMAMATNGTGITLAHEIGHAFRMEDIYASNDNWTNATVTLKKIAEDEYPRNVYMESDWNLGCRGHGVGGGRFYRKGESHVGLINRMLMNGLVERASGGRDITMGQVHGIRCTGSGMSDADWKIEKVPMGFFTDADRSESPVHY